MKKLNRTDHQESIGEIASYSEVHSRAFVLPSFLKSEWRKRFWEEERMQSGTEAYMRGSAKMRSRNDAAESGETIARPCVKNEDIQMEIWFYINHQARAVLPDHFSVSPLALYLSLSFLSLHRIRACVSLLALSSFFVLIFAIRLTILSARSPLLFREARDRHLYRWQSDSFVLSRRFQLIFIVYLPDRRYLEDNGPPLYICALANLITKAYLLFSCVSVPRGWLLSSVSAFDLSETDCVNRHCWMLLISIF